MGKRLAIGFTILVAALSAGVAAAAPAPSNVSISGQATYIDNAFVVAEVTASCDGGMGLVTVTVQQSHPPLPQANKSGSTNVICDGSQRKYLVDVFAGTGLFQLGTAEAAATLAAPSGTDTDTKTVRIVAP
jgi:hypothetical protein